MPTVPPSPPGAEAEPQAGSMGMPPLVVSAARSNAAVVESPAWPHTQAGGAEAQSPPAAAAEARAAVAAVVEQSAVHNTPGERTTPQTGAPYQPLDPDELQRQQYVAMIAEAVANAVESKVGSAIPTPCIE